MNKINLLIPQEKTKSMKSITRGFWIDKGLTYYDYLRVINLNRIDNRILNNYCKDYKQIALFYHRQGKGYIYNSRDKTKSILNNRLIFKHFGFKGLKNKIKDLLKQYSGLTIYITGNTYIIEIYYNQNKIKRYKI